MEPSEELNSLIFGKPRPKTDCMHICAAHFHATTPFNGTIVPADLKVERKSFFDCCNLDAIVATTGPKGGDSGHGGMSHVELQPGINASFEVGLLDFGGNYHSFTDVQSIRISAYGDAESNVLMQALRFANSILLTRGYRAVCLD